VHKINGVFIDAEFAMVESFSQGANMLVKPFTNLVFLVSVLILSTVITSAAMPVHRANGKIAFASMRDGNSEIYTMNSDGTAQVRLTFNDVPDFRPVWSPDGTKIAFLSQAGVTPVVKTMKSDGQGQTQITTRDSCFSCGNLPGLSWSPDGSRIAFVDGFNIFIVNVDGSNRINITNSAAGWIGQPDWSPDGSRIAFAVESDGIVLATMNPDGTYVRFITNAYDSNDYTPDWSPDGSQILYWREGVAPAGISLVNADGTNRQTL